MGRTTPKLPLPVGISTPSNTWFLGLRESAPKWHLDRFSRFCRAHERDQQTQTESHTHTHTHTDHATPSVATAHILCNAMRCGLIIMHFVDLFGLFGLCGLTVERSLAILKVAGSNLGRSASMLAGNSLGQGAHTHVPLSPSSIIWYRPMGSDTFRLGR